MNEALEEIHELVVMYEDDAWSRGDFFHQLVLRSTRLSIDTIVGALPEVMRSEFVASLRQTYDNQLSPEEFVSIPSADPERASQIEAVRRWLARHR